MQLRRHHAAYWGETCLSQQQSLNHSSHGRQCAKGTDIECHSALSGTYSPIPICDCEQRCLDNDAPTNTRGPSIPSRMLQFTEPLSWNISNSARGCVARTVVVTCSTNSPLCVSHNTYTHDGVVAGGTLILSLAHYSTRAHVDSM